MDERRLYDFKYTWFGIIHKSIQEWLLTVALIGGNILIWAEVF